jgi:hypothetical protein
MSQGSNSPQGVWDLTIKTPIGTQRVTLELRDDDGRLHGSATGAHETVPLVDLAIVGDHLTWRQSITKPLRLNLVFDVELEGDHLAGTSKAGRLPKSKVIGLRRVSWAESTGYR